VGQKQTYLPGPLNVDMRPLMARSRLPAFGDQRPLSHKFWTSALVEISRSYVSRLGGARREQQSPWKHRALSIVDTVRYSNWSRTLSRPYVFILKDVMGFDEDSKVAANKNPTKIGGVQTETKIWFYSAHSQIILPHPSQVKPVPSPEIAEDMRGG
jgi:hypothetical protein